MFTTCFHRNPNEKWIQNAHKFKWKKYLPSNSSGGLYHNVTTLFVYLLGWPFLLMLIALARPKSASFKIPCLVIRTLAAFISRWIILLLKKKIYILLKFIYSEKATKYCEILTFLSYVLVSVKSKVKISQNFVAFSEYMNFN